MAQPPPYGAFGVGAVVGPLAVETTNTLLQDADPALFYALDFFGYLIAAYAGDRLLKAAQASGAPILRPVEQLYPYIPTADQLRENQFRFPLLVMGRTDTLTGQFTAGWQHDRGLFELIYALPPLTAGQTEQVVPVLHWIAELLRYKTTQSFDPGYTPPGGSAAGATPWGPQFANVERIGFGDPYRDATRGWVHGFMEGAGEMFFPCIRMFGFMVERDTYVSNGVKLQGVDVTTDLVAPDGTRVPAFSGFATKPAPAIASLSTSSGPAAGGTAVTLTGTGFLSGPPLVTFGTTPAASIVWNSATSVSCVSPAVSGAGTLGVTLVNRDGQSASLPASFTFT